MHAVLRGPLGWGWGLTITTLVWPLELGVGAHNRHCTVEEVEWRPPLL